MSEDRHVNYGTVTNVVPLADFLNFHIHLVSPLQIGLLALDGETHRKMEPGADAARNCLAVMNRQIKAMVENQNLEGIGVLLSLAQDTCRRVIWYLNLLLERIDSPFYAEIRNWFQRELDESYAG